MRSSFGGAGFADAGIDIRCVVAGRLAEDAGAVLDAAALGIGCAVVEPPDARERDGGGAHRARLQGYIEIAPGQSLGAKARAGAPDDQQLGVRRRIVQLPRPVARGGQKRPVRANNHGADRHLAARARRFRFG